MRNGEFRKIKDFGRRRGSPAWGDDSSGGELVRETSLVQRRRRGAPCFGSLQIPRAIRSVIPEERVLP